MLRRMKMIDANNWIKKSADEYVEQLKIELEDCSKHEAVSILLKKVRYLHLSAIDWRDQCLCGVQEK